MVDLRQLVRSPRRWRLAGVLALLAWAVLAWSWRPVDLFEWDEYLYLRALSHYDVAAHSPHPPGAPAYVFLCWLVSVVIRNAQAAGQIVSVVAGALSLGLLARLLLREGAGWGPAMAAPLLLAVFPGFAFYCGVGLTDVPAVAAVVATWVLVFEAERRPKMLAVLAVVAAIGLGVRPAILPAVAPAIGWVALETVRRREWRQAGLAAVGGVLATLAVWVPAILLTGVDRYRAALRTQSEWVTRSDLANAFPSTPLTLVVDRWLIAPFGPGWLAACVWGLVVTGGCAWWVGRKPKLVAIAGGGLVLYLLVAATRLHSLWGVRYGLPLLPCLALLAAGNVAWRRRVLNAIGALALLAVGLVMALQTVPVLALRRQPAPVAAALRFVAGTVSKEDTLVVFSGSVRPHVREALGTRGFSTQQAVGGSLYDQKQVSGKPVVLISEHPVPGWRVLFERHWDSRRLQQLAFGRYGRCYVMQPPADQEPLVSFGFDARADGWKLTGKGVIGLPEGVRPRVVSICPSIFDVLVGEPSKADVRLRAGECIDVFLAPGEKGQVHLRSAGEWAMVKPMVFSPSEAPSVAVRTDLASVLENSDLWVIPLVARVAGSGGSQWRSELRVRNLGSRSTDVMVTVLNGQVDSSVITGRRLQLAAGQESVVRDDILGSETAGPQPERRLAGLLIAADPSVGLGLTSWVRDMSRGEASGGFVQAVPIRQGLASGQIASARSIRVEGSTRVSVGATVLSDIPVLLVFRALSSGSAREQPLEVPPWAASLRALHLAPGMWDVAVEVKQAPTQTAVFPFVSTVDGTSGEATYRLLLPADASGTPPSKPTKVATPPGL